MTDKLKPGLVAPNFQLPSVDGPTVNLAEELTRYQALVLLFICNHCPYVQAYIPRLVALQTQFQTPSTSARFLAICSNDAQAYPDDSFENMKIQARLWKLNFPYLWDQDQEVARAYGAERTPEIFALDRQGICRYEGGIDNNYQDATKVTRQPLRQALEAMVEGREVPQAQTHAIGCTIKWKP